MPPRVGALTVSREFGGNVGGGEALARPAAHGRAVSQPLDRVHTCGGGGGMTGRED